MAPKNKELISCQICEEQPHKYTCPQCLVVYCSLTCYKKHKESSCSTAASSIISPASTQSTTEKSQKELQAADEEMFDNSTLLRPLTSLNWPYVPEESTFPDPLKRDDPKTLQISQYEAIATSPAIRKILSDDKKLPELLTSVDKLRGAEREYALQRALGVDNQIDVGGNGPKELSEDVLAFRKLAEAIEEAVRGGKEGALGLNWGD
ncbi:hypothetical protein CPB83DRAFT_856459 [Crepidotus variabilis]|uniref:HIT-type domain-containing protein n=1 Tax=Crepidotus variabilis TaxID=179855 RepID=A0A9P6JNG9_9AGAR|nr:hypothetical protein CPB83DRAFT_856459 [Crepidotus variabilis]